METISCPSCKELVRLATAELPAGCSIRCPWCDEIAVAERWTSKLPPMAVVLDANGNRLVEPTIPLEPAAFMASQTPGNDGGTDDATEPNAESPIASEALKPDLHSDRSEPNDLPDDGTPTSWDPQDGPARLDEVVEQADPVGRHHNESSEVDLEPMESPPAFETSQSPTIDQIEEAWEESEGLDGGGELDGEETLDDDETEFTKAETSTKLKVPLANDDRSYYQRHGWGKRQRNAVRIAKIVAPSLLAIPIAGGILWLGDIDLGFYPFNGNGQNNESRLSSAGPSDAIAPTGNSSFDDGESSMPSEKPSAGDTSAVVSPSNDFDKVSENESANQRPTVFAESSPPVGNDGSQEGPTANFPPKSDSENLENDGIDKDVRSVLEDTDGIPMEQLIEEIKERKPSEDFADDDQSRKTVGMIARQQAMQRQLDEFGEANAQRPPRDEPHQLMIFPKTVPPVESITESNSIKQASAEAASVETAEDSEASLANSTEKNDAASGDRPIDIETVESDSTGNVESKGTGDSATETSKPRSKECELALQSLAQIGDSSDRKSHEVVMAYAHVARLAEVDNIDDEIDEVLSRIADDENTQSLLESLAVAWIDWSKRKTDGMLLIGRIVRQEDVANFILSDGTELTIDADLPPNVPKQTPVVVLAKIVSKNPSPRVRLIAGTVVP